MNRISLLTFIELESFLSFSVTIIKIGEILLLTSKIYLEVIKLIACEII